MSEMPRSRRYIAPTVVIALVALAACGTSTNTRAPGSPSPSLAATPVGGSAPPTAAPSSAASPAQPFDPASVSIQLESIVEGLDSPLGIANAGDGSGRLFVVEQGGTIRVVDGGRLADEPFLDISERISSGGEQGLLGLAFHPDYPSDPRLFVNYTDVEGNTQVASFHVDSADPNRADPGSETRLLSIDQPYENHNGGAVEFGPDGMLYIATGDGGSGGDPHENGQSLATLLGKILRVDVDATDAGKAYGIPQDNPFVGRNGAAAEIWSYGLRNPWRISFDAATGDLWIGDVGQDRWEEIDVARRGVGGTNYGWNRMEGNHCFRPSTDCDIADLELPVTEYGHDLGCTVIGGDVYRGSAQPLLVGDYTFADYCSGRIWTIDSGANELVEPTLVAETGTTISSFGVDEDGELLATDLGSGRLYRVVAAPK